jgi:hypothetical protein
MVSQEYRNKPELESWQRDLLDAFYMLTRARQSGFDSNPLTLSDMTAMIALNPAVGFYEPVDLIDLWQELDASMLEYWRNKKAEDEKRKMELQERAAKAQA